MSEGILYFAAEGRVASVASALEQQAGGRAIGRLTADTGPLELRRIIVEMGDGRMPVVVASPRWAQGWRAPLGWAVEFDESFPADPALREQALARIPARRCGGCGRPC